MQLASGTLLHGRTYKIVNVLGQGSFGITYLAEHTSLGKKVAIKEFFMKDINTRLDDGSITGITDGSLSHNYAQKFRKEAMNLARMDHPNIVKVTDSFDENGTFYYVMEYIEGENLNDYLKQYAVSEKVAVDIIKDVANALIYMHEEKHMLHLDLKPGNIMRRASDGHIFLIDFGLSKHFDVNGAPETSTTIGLGTAGYAPIEQANQAKNGEFRPTIDVYALGATLYKLLTRETPPAASELVSDDELIMQTLRTKGVSAQLVSVVEKAMMPSVKKRTQSVREFIEVLSTNENKDENIPEIEIAVDNEETVIGEKIFSKTQKEEMNLSDDSKNTRKKKRGLKIVMITISVFACLGLCAFFIVSREQNTYKADLRTDLDSMSYAIGMVQSQGLAQYLVEKLGVDTTYQADFIQGLVDGFEAGDNKEASSEYAGIAVGQEIIKGQIPGINKEIFGDNSTKSISIQDFVQGFISGYTGKDMKMSMEYAKEIAEREIKNVKEESVDSIK